MTVLAAMLVAAAVVWAALRVSRPAPRHAANDRVLPLLQMFAPVAADPAFDARQVLAWQPIAAAARQLYPHEFAELDRAFGGRYPFTRERLQTVHARWTSDWLVWERAHDGEFRLKAVALEASGAVESVTRAQLDVLEREKLDAYQRRYEEYVRVSKAIQTALDAP